MAGMRREVADTLKNDLIIEIQQSFQRFRAAITQPGSDGQPEVLYKAFLQSPKIALRFGQSLKKVFVMPVL